MNVDLEELRTVQTRERATDGLQELRESFYEDAAQYLESLREERKAAAADADDPFRSPRVNELTDEIETAEQVVEAIYERRIGKLVKQASLAAAGMPDDQDGLTTEEQDLYETLVARIEENKTEVLASLSGDSISGGTQRESDKRVPSDREGDSMEPSGSAPSPDHGEENGSTAAAMMDPETEEAEPEEEADDEAVTDAGEEADSSIPRTRVKVTEDVGEIFGVDERAYTLESDDVVDLPTENAEPLVDRDAAERLE